MIITQTPLRISFFGGGTDYPQHFERHGGAVLGTAIDKYAYFSVAPFYSALFDYSIRLSYRQVECVRGLDEIQHAPFRECLRWCGIDNDVEINYSSELPGYSGLGSSSTFVVGLLNALYMHKGEFVRPLELAHQAIRLEREVLGEAVGWQDQVFAAEGGLNVIEFNGGREAVVQRIALPAERLRELEAHLMLFHTGTKRRASEIAARQVQRVAENTETLRAMRCMVDKGYDILVQPARSLAAFGELLDRAWMLKRSLAAGITTPAIDDIYTASLEAGALGGKLLGAGGGGFMVLFVPPERQDAVRARLAARTGLAARGELTGLGEVPVRINAPGTRVIHASGSGA
jgi:D-glycero-alpha-D-manno-heptose-7-phosphate kinase